MKRIRKFLYAGIVVVVVFGVGYYFLGNGTTEAVETVSGQVQRVVDVTRGDLNLVVSANGVVQPINKVDIRSKASGQILELRFEEGQSAKRGDLLIALDQTTTKNDYEQAKADLALAEAAFQQSSNNHTRYKELFEKNLVSQQELDQTQTDYVRTQSQLVKAKAALSSAGERLRDTRILAPIDGVILSKAVDVGQIIASAVSNVGGGTLLATIADMEQVYVETNVDEVDIGKVRVGQSAKVVADAFPDESFTGEVVRIAPLGTTQQNVTTFKVVVLVRNIGLRLKAGMSTSVDIEIFNRRNVLLVPTEAVKDPQSEQGRVMLASLKVPDTAHTEVEADTAKKSGGGALEEFQAMLEHIRKLPQEERRNEFPKLRGLLENMSPEEREKARAQMGAQRGGQGGGNNRIQSGGGGGNFGGGGGMFFFGEPGSGPRQRKQSQVGNTDEVKEKVVMVKNGEEFVPRMIKVGASNFDYAEVVSGLQEGDSIQITSISRAKLASQQFTDRIRANSNPLGGGRR
ncbi:MAG: efflux RND transporter periplasmic adaptor subunit [Ignavibacteriae bacterium]|nr:efflux RND transporter periplasmic adaptor subunit [Ignavibacteriota bacterium]